LRWGDLGQHVSKVDHHEHGWTPSQKLLDRGDQVDDRGRIEIVRGR